LITLNTGGDVIKLFTAVIYKFSSKARVFVPVKPFQTSLLFVGKARNLSLSRAHEGFFNRVGSCFTNNHYTRFERIARDKHTSLL
jgi:hypothetical protein